MIMRILLLSFLSMTILPSVVLGVEENGSTMVVSFDGMRHDYLESYMEKGDMPNFSDVVDKGMYAKNIRTIFPSLTSASHAAIATGARPSSTGMVSNEIHKRNKKLTNRDSAFFSPLDAEPVWSVARKEGKTTATVLFPGSNPEYGYKADYAVYYGNTWADSDFLSLDFQTEGNTKKTSFPLKLDKHDNRTVYIMAKSSGKLHKYDTFYFSFDPSMKLAEKVHLDEWGFLSFPTKNRELAGFSFKLKATKSDLSDAKLYRTAVTSAVIEGPSDFKETINENFGFFPVQDDDKALKKKWITRKEYEEISTRFAQWATDVSLYIKERYKPDLLFFYYPQVDHESHNYLLINPRQPGYSKEKSERYMEHIRWAYRLSDEMLGQVLLTINKNDRIFLVSDHGMEPVHSSLSPNEELEKKGLLVKDSQGKIDEKKSKAFALSSGSIAHIFINVKGIEKDGVVDQKEYVSLQREIVSIFKNVQLKKKKIPLKSSLSYIYGRLEGKNIIRYEDESPIKILKDTGFFASFDQKVNPYDKVIIPKRELKEMYHENTGDILLVAKKGYYMAQDDGDEVMATEVLGNHGGNPSRKELFPILLAAGNGISKGSIDSKVSTLDIAPTLYTLMGMDQPDYVEGKSIPELVGEKRDRN
ncbi:alkaline phosphatase family protein [Lederbergia wuyishanensis]|uniref:AlkP superfamily phosphohydrolase/phosphomutase n=1 Tax=Lederbergia wuyishanensis TaxID=1347903 RepID=A0ABU0DAK7_9BACI|nr:alkaline phosphatase family protein [Lederbergia wuyishanensis]MCJ8009673.1 alkaline phosphatase family protein [Lederbergia wuyishanensis]MDQ0345453.1 putative AlkP superfamily phosphohydrolase/phosphomutase [Lederbergia wuyishanensis]